MSDFKYRNRLSQTNDPRYDKGQAESRIQTVPEPNQDNLVSVCLALKEAVEVLVGERGDIHRAGVSFADLEALGHITIRDVNGEVQNNSLHQRVEALEYDFIAPSDFNIVVGGTPVGTVSDAQTLKDTNYYQVPETASGFDIECEFTNVKSIVGFVSMIRYTGSASHVVNLRLYDYVNAADDIFYDIPHTATRDAYRTVLIPDDAKYINSSAEAMIRLFHGTPANGTHDIFIDYIALIGKTV